MARIFLRMSWWLGQGLLIAAICYLPVKYCVFFAWSLADNLGLGASFGVANRLLADPDEILSAAVLIFGAFLVRQVLIAFGRLIEYRR